MEWLAVIIGTVAVLVATFLRGAKSADGDTAKEVIDNVAKAKKAADDVAAMHADARRERLRGDAKE